MSASDWSTLLHLLLNQLEQCQSSKLITFAFPCFLAPDPNPELAISADPS
jgi:hypothetical protein